MNRRGFLRCGAVLLPASAYGATAPFHDRWTPLPLNRVKVAGAIGERIDLTARGNILALDVEKDFLAPFVNRKQSGEFIGVGMLTDAIVRLAFNSGDPAMLALKKRTIDALARTQEPDGYIGLLAPERRIKKAWDIHELSYIVYALVADYRFFGERSSLEVARKAADYMVRHLAGKLPGAVNDSKIHLAMIMTGFDRAMLAIHRETQDSRYLNVVTQDVKLETWDLDIVQGRKEPYYGHAYAYICRCLAQLEFYHRDANPKLLSQSTRVLNFLRKENGLLITGSASKSECWYSDHSGEGELTETCATGYLIRWLDQLLRMRADSLYGDMMERAMYNALFAAQSPDGRRLRYWAPFDGPRVYWKTDTYCCPNNFRRIISDLPAMLYYVADGGVAVNLYTASSAEAEISAGLKLVLRQETDYPNSGTVRIHVDPSKPAKFPVKLRIPRWCNSATITVNGKAHSNANPGFAEVQRSWKRGDVIELKMQMPWRLVRGTQLQQGRVAVMRGPVLYCLNPKLNPAVSAVDLKAITLDTRSIASPVSSSTARKNGTACQVAAWSKPALTGSAPDLKLTLTEFPDPDGIATYFRMREGGTAVNDELIA